MAQGAEDRFDISVFVDPQRELAAVGVQHQRLQRCRQTAAGQVDQQLRTGDALDQRRGGVERHDLAQLEHGDAVALLLRFLQVMRGQDHGVAFAVEA